ncbi:MAG: hypothetical protein QN174_01480 [Armatimonadota bacterium]|nr:hypothetical protein [Armatimonadota bacterium]MDR7423421.1 hypothetical protein [Armatimonadota bacterium]MDR7456888.1 hypothetical protein [Armatimonadota bacterium]MDR7495619.1 hypothetical protein [Armatimonadota bacterium]
MIRPRLPGCWPVLLLPVALLAATSLAPAAAADPSTAPWTTFRHPVYGFAVSHPHAWETLSGEGRAAFAAMGPPAAGASGLRLSVVVATGPVPAGASIEQADAEVQQLLAGQSGTVRVLRRDRIDLRGVPSFILYMARTTPTGQQLYQMVLVVIHRGRGYAVVGTTAAASTNLAEETRLLQRVLLTFQPGT